MSECDICKGCKCPEVRILEKKLDRMISELKFQTNHIYYLIETLEEKKCL